MTDKNEQPAVDRSFQFTDVLRDELGVVAERRDRLNAERGDLDGALAKQGVPAEDAAWEARLLGLSFSGGGIRSATFNLGVLQSLARRGVLRYVDYLSTVSGGGYVGSWLTALSHRRFAANRVGPGAAEKESSDAPLRFDEKGYSKLQERLAWTAGTDGANSNKREDRAVRFLREFSNYLTPKLGLFSGDTWALFSIYVRNALLNQLVLLFALSVLLLTPRLLSPLLDLGTVGTGSAAEARFLWWLGIIAVAHLFVCSRLGKNLAGITARGSAEASPMVIACIGGPLVLVGITAASWLGYVDTWLGERVTAGAAVAIAALAGALLNLYTWICAFGFAYLRRDKSLWGAAEWRFFSRMMLHAPVAGLVFGACLYGGSLFFGDEIYSGYRLIAGPPVLALAVLAAGVLHLGLAGRDFSSQYTEWLSRFGGLMLIGTIGWIALNALVILGPLVFAWLQGTAEAAVTSGWLATTLVSVIFGRKLATSGTTRAVPRLFIQIAPWIFIVGLGIGLSALLQSALQLGTEKEYFDADAPAAIAAKTSFYERLTHRESNEVFGRIELGGSAVEVRGRVVEGAGGTPPVAGAASAAAPGFFVTYGEWLAATERWPLVAAFIALAALLSYFLSRRIDVNVFSLHGMYANRLVRCYLGASVSNREANAFSGLSGRDDLMLNAVMRNVDGKNLLVHPLSDGVVAGAEPLPGKRAAYPGPYHLINTAINLVAGGNLAYQERKAGAFLLSPLYCGFNQEGSSSTATGAVDAYRSTSDFSSKPKPLTLGEAMATSGAAASPNMGYHTTAAFAFLMGVFNVRLGRWVGNPNHSKNGAWRSSGPRLALGHLLREAFGLTDSTSRFVYLSDGGHFENLGIYELVRRRCRYIIACDSGADASYGFEDLANAIRKCRTDLGVEIDLDVRQIGDVDAKRFNGAPCAIGRIRYSGSKVGTILYIKPTRTQGLPSDVMHYAAEHATFPHESTADQFFSESQFESYRRLGDHLAGQILDVSRALKPTGVDIDQLFRDFDEAWHRPSRSVAAHFSRLGDAADELFERLRTSKELAFLSKQFYPEWRSLLGDARFDAKVQADDIADLPQQPDELRQGFYFCNSLIQLMETVYIDLELETDWDHPDNSGWVNLFNHWAWSGMFRVTWAVSAATYGRRFRTFCERRLNLDLGNVVVDAAIDTTMEAAKTQLDDSGLNLHERQMVADLPLPADTQISIHRLELRVRNPIRPESKELIKFGFGFAVVVGAELAMYRVQDHLRGLGLGRKGLQALVQARHTPLDIRNYPKQAIQEFLAHFNENADLGKIADFRAMVLSVNEEWTERNMQ